MVILREAHFPRPFSAPPEGVSVCSVVEAVSLTTEVSETRFTGHGRRLGRNTFRCPNRDVSAM